MGVTPMVIRLYDAENEFREYTRLFVPWKVLKTAVKLSKQMDMGDLSEEDVDALAALVVEVFGGQFSVEDLNNGADVGEMIAVVNTIVAKAGGGQANPMLPG